MFQCVCCHVDVEVPVLCCICHDALWCSQECQGHDKHHSKWCEDRCAIYAKALSLHGERVSIGLIRFACKICHNDYDKAWTILSKQGIIKTDNFICDVLSGPEILQLYVNE